MIKLLKSYKKSDIIMFIFILLIVIIVIFAFGFNKKNESKIDNTSKSEIEFVTKKSQAISEIESQNQRKINKQSQVKTEKQKTEASKNEQSIKAPDKLIEWQYFVNDSGIFRCQPNNQNTQKLDDSTPSEIFLIDNKIYFYYDKAIIRINEDGKNKTNIGTYNCQFIKIINKFIILTDKNEKYIKLDLNGNKLFEYELSNKTRKYIVDNKVYFMEQNGSVFMLDDVKITKISDIIVDDFCVMNDKIYYFYQGSLYDANMDFTSKIMIIDKATNSKGKIMATLSDLIYYVGDKNYLYSVDIKTMKPMLQLDFDCLQLELKNGEINFFAKNKITNYYEKYKIDRNKLIIKT